MMERTLALIKPDAFENAKQIEQEIKDAGFTILAVSCNMQIKIIADCSHIFHYLEKEFILDERTVWRLLHRTRS